MTRFRYLIIVSLALVVSGCFAGRNVKPLTDMGAIEKPIAILPVGPENVVMAVESEDDYAKIAEETSAILDILARGKKGTLIGPKRVRRSLESVADAECLNVWLDGLRKYSKPGLSQKLIEIGNRLKVKKIIRVQVDVLISANEWASWFKGIKDSSGGVGVGGKVSVGVGVGVTVGVCVGVIVGSDVEVVVGIGDSVEPGGIVGLGVRVSVKVSCAGRSGVGV